MRDGTVRMNPGRLNPDAMGPAGPIDPELGVLWIESASGSPIAVIGAFALHYVGTDDSRHVSADYFGAYVQWMQRIYGRGLVPIMFNGTSGDINNVDVHDAHQPSGARQARHVAGGGFDKPKVRRYLWEHGRIELTGFSDTTYNTIKKWKARCVRTEGGKEMLYPTGTPEEIGVVVAGGDTGPHSAIVTLRPYFLCSISWASKLPLPRYGEASSNSIVPSFLKWMTTQLLAAPCRVKPATFSWPRP